MENVPEGGDAEPTKIDQENRKSHLRAAGDENASGTPNKVMKLQEGEDALTNQLGDEAELNDAQGNEIDSDVDLGDDDEYEEEEDGKQEADQKETEGEEDEEQLDLEAEFAGESDQAADFEGEDDFDEYEDELGTTAEETEDNVNEEEEADSSTELQDFVQANLAYIEDCQSDIDTLNHKANEEILLVEVKYNKLRLPVYKRRNTYIERVPQFWSSVFKRHSQLRQVLTKEDIKCLEYVTRLQVEDFEDNRSGHAIQFYFSENPWFENRVVTKEYHLPWHGTPSCSCTPIRWKKGMNLTMKSSSFFSWFTSQEDASADDIAEIIKDDLWPNPLQYFLMSNKQPEESEDDDEEADDSGNLHKDDSVVLLDDSHEDDVEYISSEEDEDEGDWEGKEQTTSAHYMVRDEEEEDPDDEEYDDFDDDDVAGDAIDIERTNDPMLQGKKDQMRPKTEVITVDDDYLESDDEDENDYFDGTVDPDVDERLLSGQEINEVEGSENEGEGLEVVGVGGAKEKANHIAEVQRADSSRDDANEDSRHSNGVVGSSTHDEDELDVVDSNAITRAPSDGGGPDTPSSKAGLSKMQDQSKVVSTSTTEGEPDITAGAT